MCQTEKVPSLWTIARINPIPKVNLTDNSVFHSSLISAYRKCHSTMTTLLVIRDDILKVMKRGDVTIAAIANYSKAFDIVAYETVLIKLNQLGFSKSSLRWIAIRLWHVLYYQILSNLEK